MKGPNRAHPSRDREYILVAVIGNVRDDRDKFVLSCPQQAGLPLLEILQKNINWYKIQLMQKRPARSLSF